MSGSRPVLVVAESDRTFMKVATIRSTTERPITISGDTNQMVGTDPEALVSRSIQVVDDPPAARRPALWDGHAATRIVDALTE